MIVVLAPWSERPLRPLRGRPQHLRSQESDSEKLWAGWLVTGDLKSTPSVPWNTVTARWNSIYVLREDYRIKLGQPVMALN